MSGEQKQKVEIERKNPATSVQGTKMTTVLNIVTVGEVILEA